MQYNFKPGHYIHYKGKHYELLYMARHSESMEEMVVYRALYGDFGIWVRPAAMWGENVTVNASSVPRFKFCDEGGEI